MEKKLEKAIQKIRTVLNIDGGDLEVVEYDEKKNIIKIKLLGVCQHCAMAELTITGFIQEELAEKGQKVKGVIIGFEDDIRIHRALSVAPNIEFYTYKISFKLEKK